MKDEWIRVFCEIDDFKTMKKFFTEIFTENERRDLELRWELMRKLHEGRPQREVAASLGVSLCKITRGAKIINNPKSVTRSVLAKRGS